MNQESSMEFVVEKILARNKSEILAMISKLSDRAAADCSIIESVKDLTAWEHGVADLLWMIDVIDYLSKCLLSAPIESHCDETVWQWLNAEYCELDDFFEM